MPIIGSLKELPKLLAASNSLTKDYKRVRRGEIYLCDLNNHTLVNSVQTGRRPVIIIQNDCGNIYSKTTIVAAITSKSRKNNIPTHVPIFKYDIKDLCGNFQFQDSTILFEQVFTVDKSELGEKIGRINVNQEKIQQALKISLGLHKAEVI